MSYRVVRFWGCLFFCITLHFSLSANVFSGDKERSSVLSSLIRSNQQLSDTLILSELSAQYQQRYTGEPWVKDIRLVSGILLANSHARMEDSLSVQCDSLYQATIHQAQELDKLDILAWSVVEYAYYYYKFRDLERAMEYFLKGIDLLGRVPSDQVLEAATTYRKVAYFLITAGHKNEALQYLKIAQKYAKNPSKELGDILCAIGSVYLQLQDYTMAELYFQKSLTVSKKSGDRLRQAKNWGYLAKIHAEHNELGRAEEAIVKDIVLSMQVNDVPNLIYANKHYAEFLLKQNRIEEAEEKLNEALKYALSKPYLTRNVQEIVKIQLQIARKKGDMRAELLALRSLDSLNKEVARLDGEQVVQKVSLNIEKEIMRMSLEAENEKHLRKVLWRNAIIILGIVSIVLVGLFVMVYRYRNKKKLRAYEKEMLALQQTKEQSEKELGEVWQKLVSYKEYLTEKDVQINTLKQELLENERSAAKFSNTREDRLKNLIESHLMSEEDWRAFKSVFEEEEEEFCRLMKQALPGLTESNLRILYLQRMGFNNPSIAHILGVTLEAVKKNKQRMRRKYGDVSLSYLGSAS